MTDSHKLIRDAVDAGLSAVDLYTLAKEDIVTRDALDDFMRAALAVAIVRCIEALPETVRLDSAMGDPWDAGRNGAIEEAAAALLALSPNAKGETHE